MFHVDTLSKQFAQSRFAWMTFCDIQLQESVFDRWIVKYFVNSASKSII